MPPRLLPTASALILVTVAAGAFGCGGDSPERANRTATATPAPKGGLYVSPKGNDEAACTSPETACQTWLTAFIKAEPGDVIELAAGDYGDVPLVALPRKATPKRVVFRPAKGAEVKVGALDVDGTSDIEIVGVTSDAGWQIRGMAENVVMRDVKILDSEWGGYIGGAKRVRVIGGEIGRIDPNDGLHLNNTDGDNIDVVIDGVYMHDLTNKTAPAVHTDCVQAGAANGLVIRNSRFINCATQGLFLSAYGGAATKDVVIENNWIGRAQDGFQALYVGDAMDVTLRNNSVVDGGTFVDSEKSKTVVVNNILAGTDAYGCQVLAGVSKRFAHNVVPEPCPAGTPGTGIIVDPDAAKHFVNRGVKDSSKFDLHLRPGAKAINAGASGGPATDIDGEPRPRSGRSDAGADERGGA